MKHHRRLIRILPEQLYEHIGHHSQHKEPSESGSEHEPKAFGGDGILDLRGEEGEESHDYEARCVRVYREERM